MTQSIHTVVEMLLASLKAYSRGVDTGEVSIHGEAMTKRVVTADEVIASAEAFMYPPKVVRDASGQIVRLHHVDLEQVEKLPNGYVIARAKSDGHLTAHNDSDKDPSYRGSAYPFGSDRFMVSYWDHAAGFYRKTAQHTTKDGAERFLRRQIAKLPTL